jgi:hypothetical protein
MAVAAWRLGHAKESARIAELVFTQLSRKDATAAGMKAAEVALAWLTRGDMNIGAAWMSRARRLLDGAPESTAHGYLAYLTAIHAVLLRDLDDLPVRVRELREICSRLDDSALTALALVAQGLEAILGGRITEAYRLIDEAMLPVLADQVPIEWAGEIYCVVLHHCHKVADLPRMRAWTQSMEQWCDLAGSVPEGGVCEVHRLQLQDGTDDYRQIEERLLTVSNSLAPVNGWAAAEGFYQLGEVRRLLGDFDGALAAFAKVRDLGMEPQPGEALLRCRQGDNRPRGAGCGWRWWGSTGSTECACYVAPSRSRWRVMRSTRPKAIVANWKPAPQRTERRASRHGRRTPEDRSSYVEGSSRPHSRH